jgi:glycerophosphoryl diester phosphodiesterase
LGLLVHAYTFRRDALPEFASSYEELVRFYAKEVGVDGMFTDFPDLTHHILQRISP